MPAIATQYTTIDNPAFIWTVHTKMNGLLSFKGRDKFENGKGEMLIKLNSFFTIVDEKGEKLNKNTAKALLEVEHFTLLPMVILLNFPLFIIKKIKKIPKDMNGF